MEYKLVIDQELVDEYNSYYFKKYPRARKPAIDKPRHPLLNTWMILPRIQMNNLKQKWKFFIQWMCKKLGYDGLMLNKFEVICTTYMPTRRRCDCDNTVPKFILDGFTESGFIIDDDYQHLTSLTLMVGYDKLHPRLEIVVKEILDRGDK